MLENTYVGVWLLFSNSNTSALVLHSGKISHLWSCQVGEASSASAHPTWEDPHNFLEDLMVLVLYPLIRLSLEEGCLRRGGMGLGCRGVRLGEAFKYPAFEATILISSSLWHKTLFWPELCSIKSFHGFLFSRSYLCPTVCEFVWLYPSFHLSFIFRCISLLSLSIVHWSDCSSALPFVRALLQSFVRWFVQFVGPIVRLPDWSYLWLSAHF